MAEIKPKSRIQRVHPPPVGHVGVGHVDNGRTEVVLGREANQVVSERAVNSGVVQHLQNRADDVVADGRPSEVLEIKKNWSPCHKGPRPVFIVSRIGLVAVAVGVLHEPVGLSGIVHHCTNPKALGGVTGDCAPAAPAPAAPAPAAPAPAAPAPCCET